jgi:hypothetical protein
MSRAIVVTWNPGRDNDGDWSPHEWDDMVARQRGGPIDSDRWCVGRHRNHIEPGDVCYLLRQGSFGRGIVARGSVESHPMAHLHGSESGRSTNFVEIDWTASLPLDDRITTEELFELVPGVKWSQIYQSGHIIRDQETHDALAEVWTQRFNAVWLAQSARQPGHS